MTLQCDIMHIIAISVGHYTTFQCCRRRQTHFICRVFKATKRSEVAIIYEQACRDWSSRQ